MTKLRSRSSCSGPRQSVNGTIQGVISGRRICGGRPASAARRFGYPAGKPRRHEMIELETEPVVWCSFIVRLTNRLSVKRSMVTPLVGLLRSEEHTSELQSL